MGKVKKLVAAAMVSVMSLSVVGCNMIEQTAESKAKTVLAKVGDTNITLGDVDSELKADIDNLKQTYGQDYESSIPESLKEQLKTVRTQVLNQLVNEQIMSQKAKALNLIPSDEELESKISEKTEELKGVYGGEEAFKSALEYYGYTDETFKEFMKTQVISEIVTEYMTKDVTISDEEVEQYYNTNIANYTTKPSATANHILFKSDNEDKDAADAEALAQANEAKAKIDAGEVSFDELLPIDRWALHRFDLVNQKARAGYDAFEFHQVYHAIHNFCVVDMSNFYLDVIKDRLYVEKADSKERRAAQTAMYMILDGMTRLISPILAYTSDEIWQAMKHDASADAENVVLNQMPEPTGVNVDETFIQTWDRIHDIRDAVKKALELARNEKLIRASLDAKVQLFCDGEMYDFVKSVEAELPVVFIVSQVELVKGGKGTFVSEDLPELSVTVLPAEGDKCSRCWTYSNTVGSNEKHPEVCAHCASVLE